jgi:3-hydroxyisobutyrate dehydrogenase-like beta-hydroxyacid dehydrogenase
MALHLLMLCCHAVPVFARPDGVAAKQAYFTAGGDKESIEKAT